MNSTATKPNVAEIGSGTLELIARYSELDLELYRFAEGLLDEAIARQPAEFHADLAAFTRLQAELAGRTTPSTAGAGTEPAGLAGDERSSEPAVERSLRTMLLDTTAYFLAEENNWRSKALEAKGEKARLRAEIELLRRQLEAASAGGAGTDRDGQAIRAGEPSGQAVGTDR
jgi:hypothetical protein